MMIAELVENVGGEKNLFVARVNIVNLLTLHITKVKRRKWQLIRISFFSSNNDNPDKTSFVQGIKSQLKSLYICWLVSSGWSSALFNRDMFESNIFTLDELYESLYIWVLFWQTWCKSKIIHLSTFSFLRGNLSRCKITFGLRLCAIDRV